MPSFTPKTDKELNTERLLPDGEYGFEIVKAENKRFGTGSEGIALTVGVYVGEACRFVNDNLVFTDKAMFKVSQFSKATGLYEKYKAGSIDAEDCKGRTGRCRVATEPEGEYPAKNKISSYVIPKAAPTPEPRRTVAQTVAAGAPVSQSKRVDDDEIPF